MNHNDRLATDSPRSWSAAAIYLRAEGTAALKLMPQLLDRCEQILESGEFGCKFRRATINFGELTLADIVRASGDRASEELIERLESHLSNAVQCSNVDVSAYAIDAFGIWQRKTAGIVGLLSEVVKEERRRNETHAIISLRALALRSLYLIDASSTLWFLKSAAWSEWRSTLEYWAPNGRVDLNAEIEWLNKYS